VVFGVTVTRQTVPLYANAKLDFLAMAAHVPVNMFYISSAMIKTERYVTKNNGQ
jgi:hypothetical protein